MQLCTTRSHFRGPITQTMVLPRYVLMKRESKFPIRHNGRDKAKALPVGVVQIPGEYVGLAGQPALLLRADESRLSAQGPRKLDVSWLLDGSAPSRSEPLFREHLQSSLCNILFSADAVYVAVTDQTQCEHCPHLSPCPAKPQEDHSLMQCPLKLVFIGT